MSATNAVSGPTLSEQCWLEKRLNRPGLLGGKCTPDLFRDRLRAHLIANDLGDEQIWRGTTSKSETFADAFERWYGEPLSKSSTTPGRHTDDDDTQPR